MDSVSQFAALELALSRRQNVAYVTLSAATFFLLENLINLDREIRLIWRSRWCTFKVLYILARYSTYPLVLWETYFSLLRRAVTQIECDIQAQMPWLGVWITVVVSIILQIRLHAVYKQNIGVKIVVTILFLVSFAALFTICFLQVLHAQPKAVRGTPICQEHIPDFYWALWVSPMAFDFVLVILILARSHWHHRTSMVKFWTGQRLMHVLMRDSVLYFLCGFSMYLLNTLVWLLLPHDYYELGTTWIIVILPAAATRLVLNLREEFHTPPSSQVEFSSAITMQQLSRSRTAYASSSGSQV